MKLVIVSHTAHYKDNGMIVGWGPTVREIDYLSKLFEEVIHIAPLHRGQAPASSLPYQSKTIRLCPVPPSGGSRWLKKFGIIVRTPFYIKTMLQEFKKADVIHIRCPASISLIALLVLSCLKLSSLRWIKYAGNWNPIGRESLSYAFQRWWLNKNLHRGFVTVNGTWPYQPPHIHSFLNPCFTENELKEALDVVKNKELAVPIQLIFVGRLEYEKGAERILRILTEVLQKGISAFLDIVGDGELRHYFEELACGLGVRGKVQFHGWLSKQELGKVYTKAHFILLPSASEGWPKVLSEAMAYGVVPICSDISSIPQYLGRFNIGRTFAAEDITGYASAISEYCSKPEIWKKESGKAKEAAKLFTYEKYLNNVATMLDVKC